MKINHLLAALLLGLPLALQSAEPATMRASVVTNGVPTVQEVARPEAGSGEVRVRVRAAAANPVDWNRPREGGIPGFDAAGVIDQVGSGVTGWEVGDEVIAFSDRTAAYAEYVVVPVDGLALKPAELTFAEASGIPTVAYAAWWAIVDAIDIQPGQRILIHGASGGTGSSALQIAKARGAYVIASASARNHEWLREIGADETIDYNEVRFEDVVSDVDAVFNNVDADTATRSIQVVKRGGIIASISGAADPAQAEAAGVRAVMRGRGTSIGEIMRQVAEWAVEGKYEVNVDQTYGLDEVAQAWEDGRTRHTRGKRIIVIE